MSAEVMDVEARLVHPFDHLDEGTVVIIVRYEIRHRWSAEDVSPRVEFRTAPAHLWWRAHRVDPDTMEPLGPRPEQELHVHRPDDVVRVIRPDDSRDWRLR